MPKKRGEGGSPRTDVIGGCITGGGKGKRYVANYNVNYCGKP
jgi:hypothetical protein